MRRRVRASRAPKGSSRSSRRGSRTRALARAARCASPPDRVAGQERCRSPSPTSSSARCPRSRASPLRTPSVTLASTRCHGSRRGSWNTTERSLGTRMEPDQSLSSPARMRSRVLFPVPLRPRRATNSPSPIARSTPSRMVRPPKRRVTPAARTTAAGVAWSPRAAPAGAARPSALAVISLLPRSAAMSSLSFPGSGSACRWSGQGGRR